MIKLIIADEDQNYIRALSQYLQERHGHAFDILCITQLDLLKGYFQDEEGADMLLIDQKLAQAVEDIKGTRLMLVLTDVWVEMGLHRIYKYQRADQIAQEIIEYADRLSAGNLFACKSDRSCRTICVYSPAGAAGKTTIAYHLACQYALTNQKALFISMEAFSDLPILSNNNSGRGIIFLLHLIKNKLPNLQLKLNTYLSIDNKTNVYVAEREANILEYKEIRSEDIVILTEFFKNQSDFDVLIFDVDSSLNEAVLGLFKQSDIIINVSSGCINSGKQADFNRQIPKIENYLKTGIQDKMLTIFNKSDDMRSVNEIDTSIDSAALSIPYMKVPGFGSTAYFPEMEHFRKLYDVVQDFLRERRT